METKGKTLEEIDALFVKDKPLDGPQVEEVRRGKKTIDVLQMEKEIQAKTE